MGRLETKGWIRREPDQLDRRRKLVWLTPIGQEATLQMKRAVEQVQEKITSPLTPEEAQTLRMLLAKLVEGHEQGTTD